VARNRRRYGGYIVHAGIVMLFAAFAATAFKSEHDVALKSGEAFETRDPYGHLWRFVSQGISTADQRDRNTTGITLETWRDGKRAGFITAEKRLYKDSVWIGGFVMMIGGLIVMWPQAERRARQAGYAAVMPPQHVADVPASV
jgi:cytochrome c-type biogenesis protein CcmF